MNQFVHLDDIALPDHPPVLEILDTSRKSPEADHADLCASALLDMRHLRSEECRAQVNESMLFAQLAADASCNKFFDPRGWIDQFSQVLELLGWRILQEESHGKREISNVTNWSDLALKAYEFGYAGPGREAAQVLSAARTLDADTPSVKLWNAHSSDADRGLFLLGTAHEDASGDPILALMVSSFQVSHRTKGILDWHTTGHWGDAFLVMALNTDLYRNFRHQVTQRLGARMSTDVNKIAL